jgi:hypothetical protein
VSTSVRRRCRDRCVLIAVLVMMVINHACRLPCWYPLNPVNAHISVSCIKSSASEELRVIRRAARCS